MTDAKPSVGGSLEDFLDLGDEVRFRHDDGDYTIDFRVTGR